MLPTRFLSRRSRPRAAARSATQRRAVWRRLPILLAAAATVLFVLVGHTVAQALPCEVSAARKLADGGDSDWSFVRSSIVYDQPDNAGVYQLRSMDTQGSADVCLSCTPASGAPHLDRHKIAPVWRPDGDYIVMQVEMDQHPLAWLRNSLVAELQVNGLWMNLYATNGDGSQWWQLTDYSHDQTDGAMAAHFSPDGSRLLWSRLVDNQGQSAPWGTWRLMLGDFVVDATGTPSLRNVQDVTPAGGGKFFESHGFSADGSKLIFTSDLESPNAWVMNIWALYRSTGELTRLTNSDHWQEHASYSPDGQVIAYMSSQPYDLATFLTRHESGTELFVADADGAHPRQLTHFNAPGYPESETTHTSMPARPNWGPNAASLVITRQLGIPDYPKRELWRLDLTGPCLPTDQSAS